MRFILAGLLLLSLATAAFAQARGEVESIGFDGYYRPDTWTPMVVRLKSTTGTQWRGKLEVIQEDLDQDHPIFTRLVDLSPNADGSAPREPRFWMYFIPRPRGFQYNNHAELTAEIQVFLCTQAGKQIAQLEIKDDILNVDNSGRMRGPGSSSRGCKLILCVAAHSKPSFMEFNNALGLNEDVQNVVVPEHKIAQMLPENVIGYEAVDALVWLDADPSLLSDAQKSAIEQFVQRGGKLVVSQTARGTLWKPIATQFQKMLPVDVQGIEEENAPIALQRIADEGAGRWESSGAAKPVRFWNNAAGPFDIARATARPGAVVAETDGNRPYIVHGMYGLGSVTWVAQDLGEPRLLGKGDESTKWMYVWDRVFDWPNDPVPPEAQGGKYPVAAANKYGGSITFNAQGAIDLNNGVVDGMELPSTGAALLGIALLFFIAYWALVGPGSYLFLASRKKAHLSWFVFALSALIATAITMAIVKLVLGGAPKLRHITYVRMTPGQDAVIHSDFGLYVPRNEDCKIALEQTDPDTPSYLTAFPMYPTRSTNSGFVSAVDYEIPVNDARAVSVPFRSTMKKMQACWVGKLTGGVEGAARLGTLEPLTGAIQNKTGAGLRNIYLVFHSPLVRRDLVFYVPKWDANAVMNLTTTFPKSFLLTNQLGKAADAPGGTSHYLPGARGAPLVGGDIGRQAPGMWDEYWYGVWRHPEGFSAPEGDKFKDDADVPRAFPMLSLFNRLPIMTNSPPDKQAGLGAMNRVEMDRWDLSRYGARWLDISPAISAGQLVILAQADDSPLPFPLDVDDNRITGTGVTYYQFIVPLDRSAVEHPPNQESAGRITTRPATAP